MRMSLFNLSNLLNPFKKEIAPDRSQELILDDISAYVGSIGNPKLVKGMVVKQLPNMFEQLENACVNEEDLRNRLRGLQGYFHDLKVLLENPDARSEEQGLLYKIELGNLSRHCGGDIVEMDRRLQAFIERTLTEISHAIMPASLKNISATLDPFKAYQASDQSQEVILSDISQFLSSVKDPAQLRTIIDSKLSIMMEQLSDVADGSEDYLDRLRGLYRYFYDMDVFLRAKNSEDDQGGFLFNIKQEIIADFNAVDYEDPDGHLDDIELYVNGHVDEMVTRLQTFTNIALAKISHSFDAGQISHNRNAVELKYEHQESIGKIIFSQAKRNFQDQMAVRGVVRRTEVVRRPRSYSSLSFVDPPSLVAPVVPMPEKLALKGKWSMLSTRQKWIFGSVLALEVIGVIALGVFVPGSPLITVAGTAVLTTKVLALLVGAAAFTATVVAVDRAKAQAGSVQSNNHDTTLRMMPLPGASDLLDDDSTATAGLR